MDRPRLKEWLRADGFTHYSDGRVWTAWPLKRSDTCWCSHDEGRHYGGSGGQPRAWCDESGCTCERFNPPTQKAPLVLRSNARGGAQLVRLDDWTLSFGSAVPDAVIYAAAKEALSEYWAEQSGAETIASR